mgnify:CR=1 FL=1
MKNKICFAVLLFLSSYVNASDDMLLINDSKQAIKGFALQLKSQLQKGMKAGGPVNAIQVCKNTAEDVAKQASEKVGWKIARTSLRFRNSNNAPDGWEKKVLTDFELRHKNGVPIEKLDFSETIETGNGSVFRYMKAIPTKGICLSCHGENLSAEIKEILAKKYPQDLATGFKLGDIRGAFSITRKLN